MKYEKNRPVHINMEKKIDLFKSIWNIKMIGSYQYDNISCTIRFSYQNLFYCYIHLFIDIFMQPYF